jgi:hypothetical protein
MVGSGAPILGALAGGFVFERFGPPVLFVGAAGLVVTGAAIAWVTLSAPAFSVRTTRTEASTLEANPPPLGSGGAPPP